MDNHQLYMQRCIELAKKGAGFVSPNPLVGCVIVHNERIIGEGWHQRYGEAHAEVNAINSVIDKSLLKKATLYVNLEPCSHFGKTPPCSDLLIKHQIPKVVIASIDHHEKVDGKGIQKLKNAGCEVITGVLAKEAAHINRFFFTYHNKKRPYIILKWAQSKDEFISKKNERIQISSAQSTKVVHQQRSEISSILVGTNTALIDNPHLTNRHSGKNPLRIVIDFDLKIPVSNHIYNEESPTLIINSTKESSNGNTQYLKLNKENWLVELLEFLFKNGFNSLLVEGGTNTLQQFIDQQLWDEANIYISQKDFLQGVEAPSIFGQEKSSIKINEDQLKVFYPYTNEV